MLIENAVKHNSFSAKSPLQIRIYPDDGYIVVSNNLQPRITKEISTGIGLKNIEERYRLVSGKVPTFMSEENEFVAKLPLIE
jgi:LytS/YehU family sensor histidine kinase